MKQTILSLLAIILTISTTAQSSINWTKVDNDYMYAFDDTCTIERSVFILHGLNTRDSISEHTDLGNGTTRIYSYLLDTCSLVVIPLAKRHVVKGIDMQVWDTTGQLDYGYDSVRLQRLIKLSIDMLNKPVYLIGGSNGALMAYVVANELHQTGQEDMLSGLVMLDGASPYAISLTDRHRMSSTQYIYTVLGHNYFNLYGDTEYLGFMSDSITWNIDTFIAYSLDDLLAPERYKRYFSDLLSAKSVNGFESHEVGINHNIGDEGIDLLIKWFEIRR